ncbi:MAG: hypothetical protein M4579_007236 [Chaenotheca gracillima]|nr:MAG: hypothetical protein M4579_007236 [Chaenotheca gracillima]
MVQPEASSGPVGANSQTPNGNGQANNPTSGLSCPQCGCPIEKAKNASAGKGLALRAKQTSPPKSVFGPSAAPKS